MKEIWEYVQDYEGVYEISNLGRCRTYYVAGSNKGKTTNKFRIITPLKCTNGYLEYQLSKQGKRRCYMVHRLVAKAFIPNPFDKREVNHKDEDITNNKVDNLEWLTSKENANYGTRNKRCAIGNSIKVVQLTLEDEFVKLWNSLSDIKRELRFDHSSIMRVCKGRQKTSRGYKWMYYSEYIKNNNQYKG